MVPTGVNPLPAFRTTNQGINFFSSFPFCFGCFLSHSFTVVQQIIFRRFNPKTTILAVFLQIFGSAQKGEDFFYIHYRVKP